ncbi:hypothetical protein LIER_00890 [Lithospermum erythrorhizon]|uniref:Uncharacterized protein n=1 Tax=Lithospermum erythrorhizon TaxID=34254 RepID=A0AAV3NJH6_LITER
MASTSQRIKRAAVQTKYPLRQGLIPPTHTNPIVRRGGERGDKKVLDVTPCTKSICVILLLGPKLIIKVVTFIVLYWRVHALNISIDDAGIKVIGASTLRCQGFTQENGRLVWHNKKERVARKCQRGVRGSDNSDESASEEEDVSARPRRSIHDQLHLWKRVKTDSTVTLWGSRTPYIAITWSNGHGILVLCGFWLAGARSKEPQTMTWRIFRYHPPVVLRPLHEMRWMF